MCTKTKREPVEKTPPCLRPLGQKFAYQRLGLAVVPCEVLAEIGACKQDAVCASARVRRPVDYTKYVLRQRVADIEEVLM